MIETEDNKGEWVAVEVDQSEIDTVRILKCAPSLVEYADESDITDDTETEEDIATCAAPESVGRRRSEIPVAAPIDPPDDAA